MLPTRLPISLIAVMLYAIVSFFFLWSGQQILANDFLLFDSDAMTSRYSVHISSVLSTVFCYSVEVHLWMGVVYVLSKMSWSYECSALVDFFFSPYNPFDLTAFVLTSYWIFVLYSDSWYLVCFSKCLAHISWCVDLIIIYRVCLCKCSMDEHALEALVWTVYIKSFSFLLSMSVLFQC